MKTAVILITLALSGCASEGWRYMSPPKGTYAYSVEGARNNPQGSNPYLTPGNRTVTTHEYRFGQPTGRTYESK